MNEPSEPETGTVESSPETSSLPGPSRPWAGWIAFGAFLIGFTWLYFYFGAHLIYQTNRDRLNYDQQHNITMSLKALEREDLPIGPGESVTAALWRSFPHFTDGVVNPLWPWIAARFAHDDHEIFFLRGKWFNVILGGVFLVGLGLIVARSFSILSGVVVVLLGGFGSVLPRAPFFQPETIYFILLFAAWSCAISLMKRNTLWQYALLGFLLGAAYLAKTSIQPFVLVFLAVTTLRSLIEWFRSRRHKRTADERWSLPNQFIGLAVMGMMFFSMTGPRLSYANTAYGNPFHSYPGYWMWMDDFEQGAEFMRKYGSREQLESLPPDQKPSAVNYLRTHKPAEIWERLRQGTIKKFDELMFPTEARQNPKRTKAWKRLLPQRGWLLIWEGVILLTMAGFYVAALRGKEKLIWRIGPQNARWGLLFAVGTFVLYTLAYGFYEPIGKGDRFMLSLYLPMVMTCVWMAERFRRQLRRTGRARLVNRLFAAMQWVVILTVSWRLVEMLRTPFFRP